MKNLSQPRRGGIANSFTEIHVICSKQNFIKVVICSGEGAKQKEEESSSDETNSSSEESEEELTVREKALNRIEVAAAFSSAK